VSRFALTASRTSVLALTIALTLAACAGGRSGSGSGSIPTPATPATSTGNVTFTVTVPGGTAAAAIRSIVFRLTGVIAASTRSYIGALDLDTLVPVTLESPNCAQRSDGDNVCTATASEPAPATDTFTVYTFGVSHPVVGRTVPLSIYVGYSLGITETASNTATVATNGVPASIVFSPAVVDNVPGGTPLSGSTALTTSLLVEDASGATMIGASDFTSPSGQKGPVRFTGCDPHLTPTPATMTAASPAALGTGTISIAYDGQLAAGTVHCSAIGPGGLAAQFTVNFAGTNSGGGVTIIIPAAQPVLCTPSPAVVGVNQRIVVTCASDGYAGPISYSVADPTIANVQLAVGTSTLFYVSGVTAGRTTVSFETQSGGSGQETITITP
jgi:hypothetical protein